jgi:hypothetical protein
MKRKAGGLVSFAQDKSASPRSVGVIVLIDAHLNLELAG